MGGEFGVVPPILPPRLSCPQGGLVITFTSCGLKQTNLKHETYGDRYSSPSR